MGWLLELSRYPDTLENHRAALVVATESMTANEEASGAVAAAKFCHNPWFGDETAALAELARWEPVWRSRHAFGLMWDWARNDFLARSLACVGRKDDALTELEALVNEGYNIDCRAMAAAATRT